MTRAEIEGIASWLTPAQSAALLVHADGLESTGLGMLDLLDFGAPEIRRYRDRIRGRAAWAVLYEGRVEQRAAYDAALAALDFLLGLNVPQQKLLVDAAARFTGEGPRP